MATPRRGEVWLIDFGMAGETRPALVVSGAFGDHDREITLGLSSKHRALFVSHCMRGERMRIISARKADGEEIEQYAEKIKDIRPE